MSQMKDHSIVALEHFIQAARDSGYKGTSAALAELIDNSFEAEATRIDVYFVKTPSNQLNVIIGDDVPFVRHYDARA